MTQRSSEPSFPELFAGSGLARAGLKGVLNPVGDAVAAPVAHWLGRRLLSPLARAASVSGPTRG